MAPKLGIVAGEGDLPARLVHVCRAANRDLFVLAIEGHTDPETVRCVDHAWSRLGAGGTALDLLRRAGVEELVMVGPIKRPSLLDLRPDFRTAQFLARIGGRALGDDGLLRSVIGLLEDEGFRVRGIDEILQDLVATRGPYGALSPDAQAERDIARGVTVARALGEQDVGQAVVVQQGMVLAVEGIEGTDALLERCASLRRAGPGGVLVKIKKPGQDHRVDLPTIGPATVRGAATAGLRGIAVEAGGALVVDRPRIVAAADAAGMFVVGIAVQ